MLLTSTWEVEFRDGVLRWREEDRLDHANRTIAFRQIEGDFESLSGSWRAADHEGNCRITFVADFDFGMPSIQSIVDPIAERELSDNIDEILTGLFGPELYFVDDRTPADEGFDGTADDERP